ncbi:hypothetical protein HPB52_009937 [Rhipicephalus sanguineus]|uniref:Tick transposon n=1 Tax=Rhipicephalus sanguineus TaxID=34632 RepID=A0A9D4PCG4_RHISA|nr:hypothetical protein HPB52_009937 [Rhipicephalus sanguineus]
MQIHRYQRLLFVLSLSTSFTKALRFAAVSALLELHGRLNWGRCTSPACNRCGDPETLEHLLCACPGLAQERSRVTTAYRRQGLPASTLEHFLYPSRPHLPALRSLAEFLEETGIAAYR